MREWQ